MDGLDIYEAGMLNQSYASSTRAKISDKHTLNISDYDPDGFESHEKCVYDSRLGGDFTLIRKSRYIPRRDCRLFRNGNLLDYDCQPLFWL